MDMLKIVRVSDYSEFKDYKDRWDDLLSRSHADNIFLTYEWIDACIRHFFNEEKLLILNVYNDDRLIGIAPLMIKRHKYFWLPVKSVCFIGTGISDRMDFIIHSRPADKQWPLSIPPKEPRASARVGSIKGERENILGLIMDYLVGIKSEWDFIDLEEIPDHAGTIHAMQRCLAKKRIINMPGPAKKSFYINMHKAKESTCHDFSKKFRRKLTNVNNKWHGLNLSFERYAGGGISGDMVFSELNAIENRSWKGDERSGIFSNPASLGFHREIFSKFSNNGYLDLSILNLGSRPIAYIYNYLYGKRSYNYNIAFDKRYSELSPGTLLMLWALADSSSRDIEEFDFARGEGDWKTRFTRDFRLHDRIRIFKNTVYSRFLYYLQSGIMPYMKRRKSIYNLWMKLKGWLGWD